MTAVNGDTITVTEPGGATGTIHVGSTTTYDVNGNASAKLSDITVGSFVVAEGTLRSDGSLDATAVHGGMRGGRGGGLGGPKFRVGPGRESNPGEPQRDAIHQFKRQLTSGHRLTNAARLPSGPRRVFDSHAVLRLRRFDAGRSHFPRPPHTFGDSDVRVRHPTQPPMRSSPSRATKRRAGADRPPLTGPAPRLPKRPILAPRRAGRGGRLASVMAASLLSAVLAAGGTAALVTGSHATATGAATPAASSGPRG